MDAQTWFDELVTKLATQSDVEPPPPGRRGFGSMALRVNASIFAMVSGGRFVVKLPADRVTALVQDGSGDPFRSGESRVMKEWLAVLDDDLRSSLADEALTYARARTS